MSLLTAIGGGGGGDRLGLAGIEGLEDALDPPPDLQQRLPRLHTRQVTRSGHAV